ncbi:MAG: anhydro-N-acetylmuramic acid kinase [Pseudomonadota bacterium]
MKSSCFYLGVMSGTSLDAIDCALVEFNSTQHFKLVHQYSHPIPENYRSKLFSLTQSQANEINLLVEMDVKLGELIATTCIETLKQAGLKANQITAIGSHGQTIRHYPQGNYTSSLQIGDANIICERTEITTIADFRRRDMAAGGQGAPLVPPFHANAFQHQNQPRCVVNIGGIANITCLPADNHSLATASTLNSTTVTGYDSGPGNTLMDLWCKKHLNCQYDKNGAYAASGFIIPELLQEMLKDSYFSMDFPKSTGREYFGENWINKLNLENIDLANPQSKLNILATLTELTACTIANEINFAIPNCELVLLCGGGVKNNFLIERLKQHLPEKQIKPTDFYGIPAQWIESMAFAWLAKQTYEGLNGNLPSVTGAKHAVILGAIYSA